VSLAICAFDDDLVAAQSLARALGLPLHEVSLHRFPDGEGLPLAPLGAFDRLIVYRSLDRPDAKLLPLLLLADAARRTGVGKLVLVAPYMPYLRQDAVFAAGQPVSRDVVGRLLGDAFDMVLTVQPHLHRTHHLAAVFAPAQIQAISAADTLAHAIGAEGDPIIVGPDAESRPWAQSIAARLGAPHLVLAKMRLGDRQVRIQVPADADLTDRRVVLIDDICSTGNTLRVAVQVLLAAGAARVEIVVVHALIGESDLEGLLAEGVAKFTSTDSCAHPTNRISLADLLARRLRTEIACPA
jgi:ribose-phosphate pyrophosphokinase